MTTPNTPKPDGGTSDTPRTDTAEFFVGINPEEGEMVVSHTVARQLERELNQSKAEIERLREMLSPKMLLNGGHDYTSGN